MRNLKRIVYEVVVSCLILAASWHASVVPVMAEEVELTREEAIRESLYEQTNAIRSLYGLEALAYNKDFDEASDLRAAELSVLFSHTRPDGTNYWTVNEEIYGENVSWVTLTDDAATKTMVGWANSPTHLSNMLNPGFTSVSFGVFIMGDIVYVTMEFGM